MNAPKAVHVRSSQYWDVKSPPVKKHVVGGQLVGTVRGALGRHRPKRLVLEIVGTSPSSSSELQEDDRVILRVLNPKKAKASRWGLRRVSDDSDSDDESDNKDSQYEGWVEYRKYGLDEVEDEVMEGDKAWEAVMGRSSARELREFNFSTAEQAKEFCGALASFKKQIKERAEAHLEAFRKQQTKAPVPVEEFRQNMQKSRALGSHNVMESLQVDDAEVLQILVEIVSATDLPIADHSTSDPYTICFLGNSEIHRTLPVLKSLNPIWNTDNGSIFLVQTTATDLFATSGLTFILKDYDSVTKNDPLAQVTVTPPQLLDHANKTPSERLQFPLTLIGHYKKASDIFHPSLYLRFRHASKDDIDFLLALQKAKSTKMGIYADEVFMGPVASRVKLLKRESKVENGEKIYRVKPSPDPSRPTETKWMSRKALDTDNVKPSTYWIEAGSGDLGKVYLEVLRCTGLPNMDTGAAGNKTDAFCTVIYEDCIVSTDVINDELNPRWPSWSQRAFCLRMHHASSQILIGVLDYDSDVGVNAHDPIGRISVDITNFHPNTDYILVYDLHKSVLDNVRPKVGSITLRLRIDYSSFKQVLIGSLQIPPLNYINLPKKTDFLTSYFVCHGEENLDQLDMEALYSYKAELESYVSIVDYITQAFLTIVLWRGHYAVAGTSFKLPIHSLIAYMLATRLIENWNKWPSFFFFSIGWLLLATNEQRFRNPSPWHQPMSFGQMWQGVLNDKVPAANIADNENEAAIRRYDRAMNARREERLLAAQRAEEHAKELASLSEEEAAAYSVVDEDMSTKKGGTSLNPLSPVLLPIQHILGLICRYLRILKSIILWDESFFAFAIANVCFVVAGLFYFVPWNFFIRWTLRVVVYVFMGPWMKLVDIYYVQKLNSSDPDNAAKQLQLAMRSRIDSLNLARQTMMMRKENFSKTKAVKRFMFGEYVTKVPQHKEYRYVDIPRKESFAKPTKPRSVTISERKYGQALEGDMLPRWGEKMELAAAAAKAEAEAKAKVEAEAKAAAKASTDEKPAEKTD